MKPFSIRTKVAVYAATLTTIALVVFAAGTVINVYQENLEAVDLEIMAVGHRVAELHTAGRTLSEQGLEEEVGFGPRLSTAVFDATGKLHLSSGGMLEVVARAAVVRRTMHTIGEGPGKHRVMTFPFGDELLIVAFDLDEVHEITVDLLSAYLVSLPLVAGIVGLGAWLLAGRALRPLRALTTTAAAITSERLDSRVVVPPQDDEVGKLAQVLNTMLARLETSFLQAERFAADASHDLRTPVAIMRGEIDQMLHEAGLTAAVEQRLLSLQQETARLERICESLLLLAKFDAGRVPLAREPVDLSALVRDACEDAEMLGTKRDVRIDAEIRDGVRVAGDADLLRRVLLNLADNATKFNVPGGTVRCRLRAAAEVAVLTIGNSGPGIPVDSRSRVFERFYRADSARASGGGHGLGLSLGRQIIGAHGGSLELSPDPAAGWTEFVLTLPLAR